MKQICIFIFAFITADMFVTAAMSAKANGTAEELYACPNTMTQLINPYIKLYAGVSSCDAGYTKVATRSSYICQYSGYSGYDGKNYSECYLYLDPGLNYSDNSGVYQYSGLCEYVP